MARRITKTILWNGDYGHRNPTTPCKRGVQWPDGRWQNDAGEFKDETVLLATGGDCEFKVERYKRFYVLFDCRDAFVTDGTINHHFGEWLIGCKTKAQCKRAAEVLLLDGFEAMYREFNPAIANRYDRIREEGKDTLHYGWLEHDPTAKMEIPVDGVEAYLNTKLVDGVVPTWNEFKRACYNKWGCNGRTSRLINALKTRVTIRDEVDAFTAA